MLKKRVIPALLIKDNLLVKTKKFKSPRSIGSIIESVKLYDLREVDELVLLDISDKKKRNEPNYSTIAEVSKECFVPFCVGGGINDIKTIYKVLNSGADKVSINTQAIHNPKFIKEAAKEFGSQCIVVSIDYYKKGKNFLLHNSEKKYYLDEYIDIIKDMGPGEIILTCVDKEGTNEGFDYETIKRIKKKLSIPIIASGGAGKYEHMLKAFNYCNVDAVLASSIFCFLDKTPKNAKFFLQQNGINVRI
jgi:imidazole glycerol-phosphate synthase subunit HisF